MHLPAEKNAPRDFDFIIGDWLVKHRRLNSRLMDFVRATQEMAAIQP